MTGTALCFYPSHFRLRLDGDSLPNSVVRKEQTLPLLFTNRAQRLLQHLWLPVSKCLFLGAHVVEPFSGRNRGGLLARSIVRIHSLALLILWGVFAAAVIPVLIPSHLFIHRKRPVIQYIRPEVNPVIPEGPIHIRTHNIAQGPESFVALTDLRPNHERAEELVSSILADPHAPRLMLFQEAYNQSDVLSKLQVKYPYIVHSVAPDALGLSSGFFIASQYPIEQIELRVMPMEWPERIIGRGAIKVRITTPGGGKLDLFGVHLQALLGKERADRRLEQLQQLHMWMKSEHEQEGIPQILLGDLNTSSITAWGEDNEDPQQPEYKVLQFFRAHFADAFAEEHDPITGLRIQGRARFLDEDNRRMGVALEEPTGSWYHGPFANKGIGLSLKGIWDRMKYRYPAPRQVRQIQIPADWGSERWHATQAANTARFDFVAPPHHCQNRFESIAAEIRRIAVEGRLVSAPSDHLPVDYVFMLREPQAVAQPAP